MTRRSGLVLAVVISIVVFILDQWLKRLVEGAMYLGESIPVVSGVFHLTYIKNSGGAFGILAGSQLVLLIGSAVAVAVVLSLLLSSPPSRLTTAGCGLILGGALGNLFDRLTAGDVTDYLDFRVWPIFNAADIAIVTGVVALLLTALRPEKSSRQPEDG